MLSECRYFKKFNYWKYGKGYLEKFFIEVSRALLNSHYSIEGSDCFFVCRERSPPFLSIKK